MAYSTSTLAQGCFGKVYKQRYKGKWAAIKKVPYERIDRKDLERECAVYNKSKHPNIVRLLGDITREDGKWVIPLEFVFGEDLETTIFKVSRSKIQMTPANQGTIIVGMCEGLLYLHSKDIVHQDLKPDNIMVEHYTNRAVIIDLGLAKFFKYGLNSAADIGNEAYAAPEVLQRRVQRDQRSDVWAMGKIIAEIFARVRLVTPSVCPTTIKETLKDQPYCQAVCRMVHPDPTLRASMAGIIDEIRVAGGKSNADQKDHLKIPSPNIHNNDKRQHLAPKGLSDLTKDFMKVTLVQEEWKMEMRFEEKNGDIERVKLKEIRKERQARIYEALKQAAQKIDLKRISGNVAWAGTSRRFRLVPPNPPIKPALWVVQWCSDNADRCLSRTIADVTLS
ncbi:spindle assembly checkpoint kinase-like [Salarias fasciatus]|uniref:spindle assembly checkpoint kinase-like n=1 Tax=Salarias fasciatus TaxID=181472 RepID=UPI00117676DC|nr:spindle assembly checkpoint kinase-like [Salarias fasciatus]